MAQSDDYVLNATILETHPYNSQTKYSLQGKQAAGKQAAGNSFSTIQSADGHNYCIKHTFQLEP